MRPRIFLAAALLIGLLPASLPGQALLSQTSAPRPAVYEPVLQPGDFLRITVWRKPELSGEFAIRGDGTIADPFYSTVHAGGLPLSAATERVVGHVELYETNAWVTVVPLLRVAVRGEVRQPSLYTVSPETTVLQALMLAGGPTDRGNLRQIRVIRDGQETPVDLTRLDEVSAQQLVRSGDQIVVQRRRELFRDFIAPAASVTGAIIAVVNFVTR
jgi:protein involved in polysaccharide export with SLBB domain